MAWSCAAGGLAVLLLFAWMTRESALELWYLHRLGSGDPKEKILALERLSEVDSERSIPALTRILGEKEDARPAARALARLVPRVREASSAEILNLLYGRDDFALHQAATGAMLQAWKREAARVERALAARFPSLSGDGKRGLFRGPSRFFRIDLDTGAQHPVSGTRGVWAAKISADGKKAALLKWKGERSYVAVADLE